MSVSKLLFALLFVASSLSFAKNTEIFGDWTVIKVTDGDTIKVVVPHFPLDLPLSVRVRGIDTPEKAPRAKCAEEANLAIQASAFTREKVKNATSILFSEIAWDKYGGRILATVTINDKNLGQELINAGLARKYDGGKKSSWCQK